MSANIKPIVQNKIKTKKFSTIPNSCKQGVFLDRIKDKSKVSVIVEKNKSKSKELTIDRKRMNKYEICLPESSISSTNINEKNQKNKYYVQEDDIKENQKQNQHVQADNINENTKKTEDVSIDDLNENKKKFEFMPIMEKDLKRQYYPLYEFELEQNLFDFFFRPISTQAYERAEPQALIDMFLPGASKTCDSIGDTTDNVNEFVKQLQEALPNLSELLNKASKIGDTIDLNVNVNAENFLEKVKEGFNKYGLETIGLLAGSICLFKFVETSQKRWLISVSTILVALAIKNSQILSLWETLSSQVLNCMDTVPESGVSALDADLLNKLFVALFHAISCSYLPVGNNAKLFDSLYTRLSNFKRVNQGLNDLLEWLRNIFSTIKQWIMMNIGGVKYKDTINYLPTELKSWCMACDSINEKQLAGTMVIGKKQAEEVMRLLMQGRSMLLRGVAGTEDSRVVSAIHMYMTTLKTAMNTLAKSSAFGRGPRAEPLCILIRGETGVGKSWLTMPYIISMLHKILSPDEIERLKMDQQSFIYARQQEHKYWDGYIGQLVTVFDDFGQVRDIIGQGENEFMDIIRCSNLFQNICHMASIEEKGATVFASRIIVCTTNLGEIEINSLISSDAVKRRFQLVFDVDLDPKFCKEPSGDLNCSGKRVLKLKDEFKGDFSLDVYNFRRYDLVGKHYIDAVPIKFPALLDYSIKLYEYLNKCSQTYLDRLDQLLNDGHIAEDKTDGCAPQDNTSILNIPVVDCRTIVKYELASDEPDLNEEFLTDPLDDELLRRTRGNFVAGFCLEDVVPTIIEIIRACPYHNINKSLFYVLPVTILRNWYRRHGKHINTNEDFQEFCDILGSAAMVVPWKIFCILARDNYFHYNFAFDQKMSIEANFITYVNTSDCDKCLIINDLGNSRRSNGRMLVYKIILPWVMAMSSCANYVQFRTGSKFLATATHSFIAFTSYIVAYVAIVTPIVYGCQMFIKYLYPTPEPEYILRKPNLGRPQRKSIVRASRNNPESLNDSNSEQIANKIIKRSLYKMIFPWRSQETVGLCLFVKGAYGLIARHYIDILEDAIDNCPDLRLDNVVMRNVETNQEFLVPIDNILNGTCTTSTDDQDVAIFDAGQLGFQHPNICKYFISRCDLAKPIEWTIQVITSRADRVTLLASTARRISDKKVDAGNGISWSIRDCLRYVCGTRAGDCGSPVILHCKSIGPGKITGIHVAGHGNVSGFGISSILSYEDIKEMCEILDSETRVPLIPLDIDCLEDYDDGPESLLPFSGTFVALKRILRPVPRARKSSLVRTELHGSWVEPTKTPAHLCAGGGRPDPIIAAVERYGSNLSIIDPMLLQICTNSYFNKLTEFKDPSAFDFSPISFEEACAGVPGIPYFEAIPRNTSCGFPYVLSPITGYKGKEWFFGKDEVYDFSSEQCVKLKEECLSVIEKAKSGKRSLHVYVDSLKDETVSYKKKKENRTRLISCAPLCLVIVMRMYFLPFCRFMMLNPIENGSAVGINVYSKQWSQLASHLQSKGSLVVAGDFKNFDGSHLPTTLNVIGTTIAWFCGGDADDAMVRNTLFAEIYNSIHVNDDLVYMWNIGMPSGNPLTTIVNTIAVNVYFRYSWCLLHPKEYRGINCFNDHVSMIAYGDDVIANIRPPDDFIYDQNSISQSLSTVGLTYTTENKSTDVAESYRSLEQVSFLKRRFVWDSSSNQYLAPLELETILQIPYWVKKGPDLVDRCIVNVNNALRELSLHDRSIYDCWSEAIRKQCLEKMGFIPVSSNQFVLRREILDYETYL